MREEKQRAEQEKLRRLEREQKQREHEATVKKVGVLMYMYNNFCIT